MCIMCWGGLVGEVWVPMCPWVCLQAPSLECRPMVEAENGFAQRGTLAPLNESYKCYSWPLGSNSRFGELACLNCQCLGRC